MGFLRRLLGGGSDTESSKGPAEPFDPAALDAEERARELELARFDQDRIGDLVRRQQRYANRSWTPPAQGGEIRAGEGDDGDPGA
ncbi:MAG TPA: hypothetical protein VGJ71_05280 [Candidatus Limnocylindrales bacterium]|jgi:hypothetical protein